MRVAVVELGSGSTKLLISGQDSALGDVAQMVKTNLAAGIAKNGLITEEALEALRQALRDFKTVIDDNRVDRVIAVGSEVARRADNAEELQRAVVHELGIELTTIDGNAEAEAALAGAMAGRDLALPVAMIDIGAASTEFAIADQDGSRFVSIPIGGRTISDEFIESDPPRPEELSAALSVIELHLEDLRRGLPGFGTATAQGCTVLGPGALNEVAAIELGLLEERSVDGFVLERSAAEDVFRTLATESREDRAHNPGLQPEHLDDVVGALCILVEFIRQFGVEEIVVSEQGLRHGLASELLRAE